MQEKETLGMNMLAVYVSLLLAQIFLAHDMLNINLLSDIEPVRMCVYMHFSFTYVFPFCHCEDMLVKIED